MSTCPNVNDNAWKELVNLVGVERAYYEYYNNDFEIPELEDVDVLKNKLEDTPDRFWNEETGKPRLEEAINKFLSEIGVNVKDVTSLTDREGNKVDGVALSDLLYKTIQVVQGKADVSTLPEEASHFMVALLKGSNSPLYASMFNDIQKYDIYKQVVAEYGALYNNNTTKLKEEAMAKAVTQALLGQFDDIKLEERTKSWWNRVIDYLKSIFVKGNNDSLEQDIVSYSPYRETAHLIMDTRMREDYMLYRKEHNMNEDGGEFFQLQNQEQKTIEEAIKNNLGRGEVLLNKDTNKYELHKPDGTRVPIANRVSDRVEKANQKRGFIERTVLEKISDKIRGEYGTIGHKDVQSIINREVAKRNGTIIPSKNANLTESQYNTLEKFFNKFLDSFEEGTIFLTEQTVYDAKEDEAGTIDLVTISPKGVVSDYDWKFQEFKGKEGQKSIPHYKIANWNIQLGRYGEILRKEYGIKELGKQRVIPIETKYENNKLVSVTVGSTKIENFSETNNHLKPVPIYAELTGDEKLDTLIENLLKKKEDLSNKKAPTGLTDAEQIAFYQDKIIRLNEIDNTIRSLQLTNDIQEYVKFGIREIKDIDDIGITNLSESELNDANTNMKYYSQRVLGLIKHIAVAQTKEVQDNVDKLVSRAQSRLIDIGNELIRRTRDNYGDEVTDIQKSAGWWQRQMRTLSQQQHPILRAFYNLIKETKVKTREEVDKVQSTIFSSIRKLTEYYETKGIGRDKIFDELLTKDGDIVAKYSSEFTAERNKQRELLKNGSAEEKLKAKQWFTNNTIFDSEKYNEVLEAVKKRYKIQFRNYDNPADAYTKAVIQFEDRFDPKKNGYLNNKNYYIKPSEGHYSDEYKHIQETPQLKEFYDLFTDETTKYQQILGLPINNRFVWNIKKDFIDSLAENGFNLFNSLDFLFDIEGNTGIRKGNVDSQGEPIHEIPKMYVNPILKEVDGKLVRNTEAKSRDLGRVLLLASHMTYNYKHMSEIEDATKALEIVLKMSEEKLIDNNGNEVENPLTNRVQKIIGSANTLEQFHDYMNYYLYGIRMKTKDYIIDIFGKKVSGMALYNLINKTFVGKVLAFSPTSIIANAVSNTWNARMVGAGGRWFTNEDYSKAMTALATRDEKAYAIANYFDLIDREDFWKKATDLSISSLVKNVTYEKLFLGQKIGDSVVRNSVLLSMLKSFKLEGDKTVRIQKGDDAKNLSDLIEIKDGKLDFSKIPDKVLEGFRNKVLEITDNILGNNSRDDIRISHLTLLGRALTVFRSWIPRTVDSRFGELRYNQNLDEYEIGRYRSLWGQIVNKQFFPLLADTIAGFGFFGYGGKFGNTTIEHAKQLFRDNIAKNPGLIKDGEYSIREQEFVDAHLANLRSNMLELQIIGTMMVLLLAVAPSPDDDEDDSIIAARRALVRQMQRNLSEIEFYYSPTQFAKIIKSPIPITSALNDLGSLIWNFPKEIVGEAVGNEKWTSEAHPVRDFTKLFPIANGIERGLEAIEPDYWNEKPTYKGK